ncbi:hypothetical protein D3C87_1709980 [compost metagenome]
MVVTEFSIKKLRSSTVFPNNKAAETPTDTFFPNRYPYEKSKLFNPPEPAAVI